MCRTASVFVGLSVILAAGAAALADCDVTPPNLTAFSFTPNSVNTSSADRTFTCSMTFTDALSGTTSASCFFQSPSGNEAAGCVDDTPTAGNFSCTVTLPKWSENGVWVAQAVLGSDAVGNNAVVDTTGLITRGFPTNLTNTANPDDTSAPTIGNVTLNPTSVNTTAGPANVTCSVPVTDPAGTAPHNAQSGVSNVSCTLASPSRNQAQSCLATTPTSGTRTSGTFSCTITLPRYSESGTWTLTSVTATDIVGLDTTQTPAGKTVTVTSSPDTLAPTLIDFDFTPKSVSTISSAAVVGCTMEFADSPAGVQQASCSFTAPLDPFNPVVQTRSCTSTTPSSGTRQSGTFTCNVTLPRYAKGGSWTATVSATDAVGNDGSWDQFMLLGMGLPNTLAVDCGAGSGTEANIRFSNETTLIWLPVSGALTYNVYRGDALSLPDYGACQNSRDPNLADTVFVDADVPLEGEGFTYLVSYETLTGEQGIGTTSGGFPRFPSVPCP